MHSLLLRLKSQIFFETPFSLLVISVKEKLNVLFQLFCIFDNERNVSTVVIEEDGRRALEDGDDIMKIEAHCLRFSEWLEQRTRDRVG